MAKDTFYFSHDYEPLSDPKLLALVGEYGAAGYGIYWRIVEMLHSDEQHQLEHELYIYTAVAKQMLTTVEQVQAVLKYAIEVCKLFESDGSAFWCERVFKNIGKREEIVENRRKAGRASAEARKKAMEALEQAKSSTSDEQVSTHVQQSSTESNKENESKEKESKVKEYKKTLLSDIYISDFPELKNDYLEAAKAFNQLFIRNLQEAGASSSKVEKAKGTSIDDIRLLIEVDKYSIEDLRSVYEFLQKNAFWKKNILSTSTLREKMDKLKMELKNGTNRANTKEGTSKTQLAQVLAGHFGS